MQDQEGGGNKYLLRMNVLTDDHVSIACCITHYVQKLFVRFF